MCTQCLAHSTPAPIVIAGVCSRSVTVDLERHLLSHHVGILLHLLRGRVRKSGSMSARETPDVIRCVYSDLLASESVRDITEIPVSPIVDRGAVGRGERNRVPNEHVGGVAVRQSVVSHSSGPLRVRNTQP